jgi:hypothetical protein
MEESNHLHALAALSLWTRQLYVLDMPQFFGPEALGYGLDNRGSKVQFSAGALGLTQPPIQQVPGALSLGVKRPGREVDHSPPSNVEVKEWVELNIHSLNSPS